MQKELPTIEPLQLVETANPFNDNDWLFEIKYDGIRALTYIVDDTCELYSICHSRLNGFNSVASSIQSSLRARESILDGELVSMDENGVIKFSDLVERKGRLCYFAFDLLLVNGRDQRDLPLIERKRRLKDIIPSSSGLLRYADHVVGNGVALFDVAVKNDLEGIVAKPRESRYEPCTVWYKINAPHYTQASGHQVLKESAEHFYRA
ncbi:MAG: ligase [Acidobacteriales bacterium]|nr:ligase [Terriglobales bacterium]